MEVKIGMISLILLFPKANINFVMVENLGLLGAGGQFFKLMKMVLHFPDYGLIFYDFA
jgi:heme oxygenase